MTEEQVRQIIREELARALFKGGKVLFERPIQLLDGRNIQLGITTGTKIGTGATQKIGFFNATPVAQRSVSAVAGGAGDSDGTARGGVNNIITALQQLGLFS